MDITGKRYPKEFRDDVVRVARQGDTPLAQLATDFGVSEASIYDWVKQADIDDGVRPGLTEEETVVLREVKKRRNRVLEEENLILRRAAAFFARDISPK